MSRQKKFFKKNIKSEPRTATGEKITNLKNETIVFGLRTKISEATVSFVLGLVIVLSSASLVYMFFSNRYAYTAPKLTVSAKSNNFKIITDPAGQISGGKNIVALPATHIVEKGENLWKIAEYYYSNGVGMNELMKANNIKDPNILDEGQKILVPAIEQSVEAPEKSAKEIGIWNNKIVAESYIVKEGDDLWSISLRAYGDGYRWADIVKANGLSTPDNIEVGTKLMLPR